MVNIGKQTLYFIFSQNKGTSANFFNKTTAIFHEI